MSWIVLTVNDTQKDCFELIDKETNQVVAEINVGRKIYKVQGRTRSKLKLRMRNLINERFHIRASTLKTPNKNST